MFVPKKFSKVVSLLALQCALFVAPSFAMDAENIHPSKRVKISSGEYICYSESEGNGIPLVLIHANSTSKEIFDKQMKGLGQTYKVIAFDLPGHGESDDALDPHAVYSFPGYAKALIEAMEIIGLKNSVICGLSLGGHVGIEMLKQRPDLVAGLVISGSAPIPLTPEGMKLGFKPSFEGMEMIGQEAQFTWEESQKFLKLGGFDPNETLIKAGMRTDGKARSYMIQSIRDGEGSNHKEVIENSPKPVAIFCGAQDAGINNDYIKDGVKYNENLFGIITLEAGHACNMQKPEEFNTALIQFMEIVTILK